MTVVRIMLQTPLLLVPLENTDNLYRPKAKGELRARPDFDTLGQIFPVQLMLGLPIFTDLVIFTHPLTQKSTYRPTAFIDRVYSRVRVDFFLSLFFFLSFFPYALYRPTSFQIGYLFSV